MKSQAVAALESLLETRRYDHTLIRPWSADAPVRMLPTGLPALDQALSGGWRQGEVSEVVGPASSGRTSIGMSALAAVTAAGGLAAVVDAMDRFDPAVASAFGCDLDRVLWVRGPSVTVPDARVLDRLLRQAVRACDLIVRAGGFSLVVLDVADVPARTLRSLPTATWMRLARVNEGQKCVCLLIGPMPLGRSARGVTVHLSAVSRWIGTSPQSRRFAGLTADATLRASHALFGATALVLGSPSSYPPRHAGSTKPGARHDVLSGQ